MSDAPTILIDCDGVLVDNLHFERDVTNSIIVAFASQAGISLSDAESRWSQELSATRGYKKWYDYAFHASRLGLEGPKVARDAHYAARSLLKVVRGADTTLKLLQEYGLQVCVVTDATRWVVEFKLAELSLNSDLSVFSSTDASATKASKQYWSTLANKYVSFNPLALIDNRRVNLSAADSLLEMPHLIQFDQEEHVMTLSTTEAPTSESIDDNQIHVVHNHAELQIWLKSNIL